MAEKLYEQILDGLGEDWRADPESVGNAAIAVAATTLQDGRCDLPHLASVREFTKGALENARTVLRENEVIVGKATDCKLAASKDEIEDTIWWVLIGCVGAGFLEMSHA